MSAADDYPEMRDACKRFVKPVLVTVEAANALAEIDALRAENARLKAQLADARDADAALHDHITNGGKV